MTDIAFYQLQEIRLEEALPKLLERTLEANKRAVVRASTSDCLSTISSALWAQSGDTWLPHGMQNDKFSEDQPIWLTIDGENPNGATFIFLVEGVEIEEIKNDERCFDLFDGNDAHAVTAARERWRSLKEAGHDLQYWQQNDTGKWKKKAK